MKTSSNMPSIYGGIYALHKYWAKKPHNIINEYIQKYSKRKDIVLDPFCGSGIGLFEAFASKRKSIGIDINPIAISISKGMLVSVDAKKLENEFNEIEIDCKEKINSFYKTRRNQKSYVATHFIWANNALREVRYKNKKNIFSKPTSFDTRLANSFSYENIKEFFPKKKLIDNSKINANSEMRICDLFTPRNTHALAILLNRINNIRDKKIQRLFRLCFSSMLGQTSKMVFVINNSITRTGKKKIKKGKVGSWIIGYWMPDEHFELNVWNCFYTRYRKVLSAKKSQCEISHAIKFATAFSDLKTADVLLLKSSAIQGLRKIPDKSIDYIITDPPHGDRIPYLELSQMWNGWMKNRVNFKNEMIISDSKSRNKNTKNYAEIFEKTMFEMVRVLKPNHYLTLIFNTHDEKIWQEIFAFTEKMGLKIHNISTINYSHTSIVQQHKNRGLRFDFALTFKKPR